jgi:hypothetical protein
MPTARPSLLPSAGVTDDSSTNPLSVVLPVIPIPRTAVSSGIPAATSDPNVTSRTNKATTMPMASAELAAGVSESASPPMATRSPASSARSRVLSSASLSAAVRSTAGRE